MVPHTVLDAFGLGGTPWRLPGGEERTYHQRVEAFLAFEHARHFDQLLLRALIRTLLVADGFGSGERLEEYRPSIEIVRARLARWIDAVLRRACILTREALEPGPRSGAIYRWAAHDVHLRRRSRDSAANLRKLRQYA